MAWFRAASCSSCRLISSISSTIRAFRRPTMTNQRGFGVKVKVFSVIAAAASLSLAGAVVDQGSSAAPVRPNIVLILTDDLSWNLVRFMPHVRQMERQGATFRRFIVTDSLCCPSRASIFTGKFPHNTGIFTNGGREGGFHLFHDRGEENQTFATRLQSAGYL